MPLCVPRLLPVRRAALWALRTVAVAAVLSVGAWRAPDVQALEFHVQQMRQSIQSRFGEGGVELTGLPVRLYLLVKPEGSVGAGDDLRRYDRHWTPVHLDLVVEDLEPALAQALAAGATLDSEPRTHVWGRIAVLADPFGSGFCLLQFLDRGYDEIAPAI